MLDDLLSLYIRKFLRWSGVEGCVTTCVITVGLGGLTPCVTSHSHVRRFGLQCNDMPLYAVPGHQLTFRHRNSAL